MTRSADELQAVILAAGKGRRIAPFSSHLPKPLLPVVDRTIIEHQITRLADFGVRDVAVVIGHLGSELVRVLGDGSRFGVRITYMEQEHPMGLAHAVSRAESWVDRPFFVLLGDIWFTDAGLDEMRDALVDGVDGVIAVKEEHDVEAMRRNFAVYENGAGDVIRVVEKPLRVDTTLKGCGIYLFEPSFFEAIRRTPRTVLRNEFELTDAIQLYVDAGHRVRGVRAVDDEINVTEPRDLLAVNLQKLGDSSWIHPGAKVHPGATIVRSVVLEGARVEHPIRLEECLILQGATVRSTHDLARCIVTSEHIVDCG